MSYGKSQRSRRFLACLCALGALICSPVSAQTDTTFTYQGALDDQGAAANGLFDLNFSLFDAPSGGAQVGSTIVMNGVQVSDGLLTAELDFGTSAFDNTGRWLEITVNGIALSPRQPITRSPYSIQTRGIVVDEINRVGIGTDNPLAPLDVQSGTLGVIRAQATRATAATIAVMGVSDSTTGTGVRGFASADSGANFGGKFLSNSSSGTGVYGKALHFSGITYGGYFEAASPNGRGVFGIATRAAGINYGGRFESASTSGRGVYGYASAGTGLTDGVFGHSESTSGRGIDGWAAASSGTTYGVVGTSSSTSGVGVMGDARASTGTTFGVIGKSNSSSGFDFFASGAGTNYGASSSRRWKSNIVPISDPLRKLAQLRGVYYDWDEEHGGQHDVGMIAEEVGAVLPEIVQYEGNGVDAIGMDYSKMTPLLVEAVNALQAKQDSDIATMRSAHAAEINDLRQQLSDLQQIVQQLASNQEKENR